MEGFSGGPISTSDIKKFDEMHKDAWICDPNVSAFSDVISFETGDQKNLLRNSLAAAKKALKKINKAWVENLSDNVNEARLLETYNNSGIRAGSGFIDSPKDHYAGFVSWMAARREKDIASVKTDKGKAGRIAKWDAIEEVIGVKKNKKDIIQLFRIPTASLLQPRWLLPVSYTKSITLRHLLKLKTVID